MPLSLIVTLLVIVTVVLVAIAGAIIDRHAGSDDDSPASGGSR